MRRTNLGRAQPADSTVAGEFAANHTEGAIRVPCRTILHRHAQTARNGTGHGNHLARDRPVPRDVERLRGDAESGYRSG